MPRYTYRGGYKKRKDKRKTKQFNERRGRPVVPGFVPYSPSAPDPFVEKYMNVFKSIAAEAHEKGAVKMHFSDLMPLDVVVGRLKSQFETAPKKLRRPLKAKLALLLEKIYGERGRS